MNKPASQPTPVAPSEKQKGVAGIFRRAAVEKLSSPEQLDYLIVITSPVGWLAVMALAVICGVVTLWGIFGQVPDKVAGSGILIRGPAVFDVSAGVEGTISEIYVKSGQMVHKGDLIASLRRPDLEEKIRLEQDHVNREEQRDRDMTARENQTDGESRTALGKQDIALDEIITKLEPQEQALNNRLNQVLQLQQQGLETPDHVLQAQNNLFSVQRQVTDSRVKRLEIISQRDQLDRATQRERNDRWNRIEEAKRQLDNYQSELRLSTKVITQYEGRVVETLVEHGDPVVPKDRIATIEAKTGTMQATLYVPAGAGKKIKNGMEVQIAPSTVKPEEYGFIIGTVINVSSFPSTKDEMHRVLRNDEFAQQLLQAGSPIEIEAELVSDPHTQSGFKWSSPGGPPTEIHTGTPCTGNVVTETKRPVEFIIPKIKETLGIQ